MIKFKMQLAGLLFLFTLFTATAQSEEPSSGIINHRVEQGETVMLICKRYLITPQDVYKLNPKAVDGLTYNMVLQIPADKRLNTKPKKQQGQIAMGPKTLADGTIAKNE